MNPTFVQAIKTDLEARGIPLAGPCGAFEITARVAWALRDRGCGLLAKSAGNHCRGYAVDYLVFQGEQAVDILGDAGGANDPRWAVDPDPTLLARWRPPIDLGDEALPPPPPPPPAQPPADLSALLSRLDALLQVRTQLATTVLDRLDQLDIRLRDLDTRLRDAGHAADVRIRALISQLDALQQQIRDLGDDLSREAD